MTSNIFAGWLIGRPALSNPDTSFLAKVPADVAWTFQTLDNNGMVLNMAQTWHQVRPGEVRHDCGGCHAHSQQPTSFEMTAAASPNYKVWDLAAKTPLFSPEAITDSDAAREDPATLNYEATGVKDVEFYRDIKPLLDRSCVGCHTQQQDKPAGGLVLDDYAPLKKRGLVPWAENVSIPEGLPKTYARLAQYSWAYQARRSPLIWKVYGRRLDGFKNEDIASPALNYESEKNVLEWCHQGKNKERDVDYTGLSMPPPAAIAGTYKAPNGNTVKVSPLTAEEKLTLARWVDIGCPIDLDYDPEHPEKRGRGWLLDEGRPTLTLSLPASGKTTQPLASIRVGMHDYATGLDLETFSITADFEVDGALPGENLADKFKVLEDSRWELSLRKPIRQLAKGVLTVSVKDKQGNIAKVERTFSVAASSE